MKIFPLCPRGLLLLLCIGLCSLTLLPAQETAGYPPIPPGFGELRLGSSFEEAEAALYADSNFMYRGPSDVSMLRRPNERMIETGGLGYIHRAYLQFHEEKLYSIVLDIDVTIMDHYALYTAFTEKYGPPDNFSPSESRWEDENVIFTLERKGLRVKYLDARKIEEIRRSGNIEQSFQEMTRDRFLDQF
jgi:hypothetical protein